MRLHWSGWSSSSVPAWDESRTIDCLIPSANLLHSLLSQPITVMKLQLAHWPVDDDAPAKPLPVLTNASTHDHAGFELYYLPLDICPRDVGWEGIARGRCGIPVANEYCRSRGFAEAVDAPHTGAGRPTH